MIPDESLHIFVASVNEATLHSLKGDIPDGYELLLAQRHATMQVAEGQEWADQLGERWRQALDRYAERWGVARG